MNKILVLGGTLATVVCIVLTAHYYDDLDLSGWSKSEPQLAVVTPDDSAHPVQLSKDELAAVQNALDQYAPLIENAEIQLDGFSISTYMSGSDSPDWTIFAMAIDLKDGTELRSRPTKTSRAGVEHQLTDFVHRAMRLHEQHVKKGRSPTIITNI